MKYVQPVDRATYVATQLSRGSKFAYCKVSFRDVRQYLAIIRRDKALHEDLAPLGPILGLGVRNGREVDLFRIALTGSWFRQRLLFGLERQRFGYTSWMPWVETLGLDRVDAITPTTCLGVELNPMSRRPDVWAGSFDALPSTWSGQFSVIFSNAFDHAYHPQATAAAWRAVLRPGGYLVLDFPAEQDSSPIEPIGRLVLDDVRALFLGRLVWYAPRGSARGYTTYIICVA